MKVPPNQERAHEGELETPLQHRGEFETLVQIMGEFLGRVDSQERTVTHFCLELKLSQIGAAFRLHFETLPQTHGRV